MAAGKTTLWMKKGSDLADKYAKEGASEHRAPEQLRMEIAALNRLAKEAALFAARSHAASAAMLKDLGVAEQAEPGFRRKHIGDELDITAEVEESADDIDKPPFVVCPPCGESTAELPVTTFRSHCLLAADVQAPEGQGGSLIFCAICGAFAEKRPQLLKSRCKGRNSPGLSLQRSLLAKLRYPQSGSQASLSTPCRLTHDQVMFLANAAGDSSDSDEEQQGQQARTPLTRSQLLPCFGVTEDLLQALVVKEQEAAVRKARNACSRATTAEDSDE